MFINRVLRQLPLLVFVCLSTAAYGNWATDMFTTTSHNFGNVARGANTQFHFIFENKYQEDVVIETARTSCRCTQPSYSRGPIKTGQKGEVVITIDTNNFSGRKDATITVRFAKPFRTEVQLHSNVFIRSDVFVKPGKVMFGTVPAGEKREQRFTVNYAGHSNWRNWKIQDILSESSYYTASLKEVRRDVNMVSYEINLGLKENAPVGYIRDFIDLISNDPIPANRHCPVAIEGLIEAPISAKPSPLSLGIVSDGETVTKTIVLSGQKPFQVIDFRSSDLRLKLQPKSDLKKVHLIPVSFTGQGKPGKISGFVNISVSTQSKPVTLEFIGEILEEVHQPEAVPGNEVPGNNNVLVNNGAPVNNGVPVNTVENNGPNGNDEPMEMVAPDAFFSTPQKDNKTPAPATAVPPQTQQVPVITDDITGPVLLDVQEPDATGNAAGSAAPLEAIPSEMPVPPVQPVENGLTDGESAVNAFTDNSVVGSEADDMEPETDSASPLEVATPSEVASPLEVATPSEVASPLEVATPSEVASPLEVATPSEMDMSSDTVNPEGVDPLSPSVSADPLSPADPLSTTGSADAGDSSDPLAPQGVAIPGTDPDIPAAGPGQVPVPVPAAGPTTMPLRTPGGYSLPVRPNQSARPGAQAGVTPRPSTTQPVLQQKYTPSALRARPTAVPALKTSKDADDKDYVEVETLEQLVPEGELVAPPKALVLPPPPKD